MNPLFLVLLVFSVLIVGCRRESTDQLQTGKQSVHLYTEAELNNLISTGMSTAEVTNKFGAPDLAEKMGQNTVLLLYSFPIQPQEIGWHLSGFTVYIKDGNVAKWSPTMRETRQMFQGGDSSSSVGGQSFQLFLATDSRSNIVNTIDSQGNADSSVLTGSADLAFKAKLFTGNSGDEKPGEQTVVLVLSEQDASKLNDLTKDNVGKRLLIVSRDKVVAAPIIVEAANSRQLMFTTKGSNVLNSLQRP